MSGTCPMGSGETLRPGDLVIVWPHDDADGVNYGIILDAVDGSGRLPGSRAMCRVLVKGRVTLLFKDEFKAVEGKNV